MRGNDNGSNGEIIPEGWKQPVLSATNQTVRMKQLEVDFSGIILNKECNNTVPVGWEPEKKVQTTSKRLIKKLLAKTNKKVTMYIKKLDQQQGDGEVMMEEVDDLLDDATLERKRLVAEKDKEWENIRMITAF